MFTVYFPVWIDQHAPPKKASTWIGVYFFFIPFGLLVGYGAAIYLKSIDTSAWKYGFLIHTILMLVSVVLFMLIPSHYFKTKKKETVSNYTQEQLPLQGEKQENSVIKQTIIEHQVMSQIDM